MKFRTFKGALAVLTLAMIVMAATTAGAALTWDPDGGGASDGGGAWLDAGKWWDGGANVTSEELIPALAC